MFTHHAYYIEDSLARFDAYKEALGETYIARSYVSFGVDDARELSNLASLKGEGQRLIYIGVAALTSEAQQALLKLFEEPQEGIIFIVLIPHGILLPTLKSRMLKLDPQELLKKKSSDLPSRPSASRARLFSSEVLATPSAGREFLSWSYKKRSDWIAEFLEDDDEESPDKQVRERVRNFLTELESALASHIADPAVRVGLEDIAKVRIYLSDRSPSLKMLLEHLAAAIPNIK